jgi:hypothetical protein
MNASNSSALKGNLKSLMATGGLLAGAGTASQAAIVHTDISDLTVSAGGNIYFSLTSQAADTTGAVVEQFRLFFFANLPGEPSIVGVANSGAAAGYLGALYSYSSVLTVGATVNNSRTFFSSSHLAYGSTGEWDPGDRGYLGLRIDSGGIKYGWADVSYNANNSLTLYSFAYENSGASIAAGVVPEPATTGAMAAILAGAVGAFEARRRRKAARLAEAQSGPVAAS